MGAVIKQVIFTDNSDQVTAALEEKVITWLESIGQDAAGVAADYAPVDTGRLRNSISSVVDESEKAAYIGTNVEYAPYQEFGTSKIEGKHFIQFGATAHLDEYKSLLEEILSSE